MKILGNIYLLMLCGFFLLLSCNKKEIGITDEVFEFVFLSATEFSMNELTNSTAGNEIVIHAEMLAAARSEDVILNLTITGTNATEGQDYEVVSSNSSIVIPAGSFTSNEGFKIRAINNGLQSTEDRSIEVLISGVSDPALNIGKGLSNPTNTRAKVEIVDDECSDQIVLFNNAEWSFEGSNTVYYSEYAGNFVTTINGDKMTITGDIANYDVGITVLATITPNPDAPTTGTITFDPSSVGNDGTYDYRWVLAETGTYDICAQTIQLSTIIQYIDIYGPDPTAWVDWYVSTITASIVVPGGEGPAPPTGTLNQENISIFAGEDITISGSFADAQGLSEVKLVAPELGIDQTLNLSGELSYELNETYTIPAETAEGDYDLLVTVTNTEGLSTNFNVSVSVSVVAGCTDDFTVFQDVNLEANVNITTTDGSFDGYAFMKDATAVIADDTLTITGDIIDFFEIQLKATFTSDPTDSKIGTLQILSDQPQVIHTDGFTYRLNSSSEGTYDACMQKINMAYDIEYSDDNGGWIFYYSMETEFKIKN